MMKCYLNMELGRPGDGERVAKPGDMLLMAPFHDTRFGIVL